MGVALRPAGGVATAMPPSAPRVTTAATPATMAPLTRVSPRVLRCVAEGSTVTFDTEAAFAPGRPRQHVYGAVRFLEAPYSTFQIVRAGSSGVEAD